jgi:hypothetical protein
LRAKPLWAKIKNKISAKKAKNFNTEKTESTEITKLREFF